MDFRWVIIFGYVCGVVAGEVVLDGFGVPEDHSRCSVEVYFIEKVLEENEGLEQENITLRRRVNEMEDELGFLHGTGNSIGRN